MTTTTMNPVTVIPSGAALGADITGVDLSRPLTDEQVAAIIDAWHQHLVLRIRGQSLSDADLIRFSQHFGELDLAPISSSGKREIPEHPEIVVISNVKEDGRPIGSLGNAEAEWHTDMSYVERPPKMSCLYSLEVPEEGGNTSFLNMYTAYEALPDDLKLAIIGKRCKHDISRNSAGEIRKGFEAYANEPDPRKIPGTYHPLVCSHPKTGRQCLYLGRRGNAHIEGLGVEESEALLDQLWAYAIKLEFRWDQVWRVGDLILWDNRCTMHRRDAFDDSARRIMHRTQVKGETRPA
ncbi:TauD/TfdA family dioxygenase [Halomonas daqingensis]|uniref:TauD/TfdA family dioxygenase n=1 Tax=Billgrantia desiderata TaxID=52021 RepID=A0ABS9B3Y9_9GAMM|nr:TauD/TfdA family dioxygenase [Halomonas desiderata]MCE8042333.1 TauD/TfdA family dioxygenase [Halomonas desiderata]MCE8046908.1 TauD/TfdA family dioxygenase [Halomonas desiderata]